MNNPDGYYITLYGNLISIEQDLDSSEKSKLSILVADDDIDPDDIVIYPFIWGEDLSNNSGY